MSGAFFFLLQRPLPSHGKFYSFFQENETDLDYIFYLLVAMSLTILQLL
jgi:hypothetical protein